MIAVDTNVLVYAHREEFAEHRAARELLMSLAEGAALWGIPVFCLGEFLRVVTHPEILRPPTPLKTATATLGTLLESASLRILAPGDQFPRLLFEAVAQARATGNLVVDAQIVAVCREHGVRALRSNDRDFARFTGIETRPLS